MSDVAIDRWDLVHLLLSVEPRDRVGPDARDLESVVARAVAALATGPPRRPITVPGPWTAPLLVEGHPGWIMETNCWLVARDGMCVVVDVPPDPCAVLDRMAELGLEPVAVALTHGHPDHSGGVAALLEAVGRPLPVHVHPGDRDLVLRRDAGGALAAAVGPFGTPPADLVVPHTTLWLGDVALRPIPVPGHTRGSTCLLVEGTARPLLFTGDALFAGGTGRCDLAGGRRPQAERSLRELIRPMDDDVVVLPGHGPTTTVGAERARVAGLTEAPAPVAAPPGAGDAAPHAGDVRRMPHRRPRHGGPVPTRWASGRC